MFKRFQRGIKKIKSFFFDLNESTKILIEFLSFRELKEIFVYHLQLRIVDFEKNLWIHWIINFRKRRIWLILYIPCTYVFLSVMDYYLCLHHGTDLNSLSFTSIEEDMVGFLEMSFYFEAGDWVSLGSWDLLCAWPVLYLYAILATFSLKVHRITDPFIAMWWLFVLSMFHSDNDLFFEYLSTTNADEHILWWMIYAVASFIGWALFDFEVQEFEERLPMEDRMERMARRSGKQQLFDYWFRDEPQHRAYDDLIKDHIKAFHFMRFYYRRKVRWEFWTTFSIRDLYQELLFGMTGFGLNHRVSLDELPKDAKKRYFRQRDKEDMEDFEKRPKELPNYYEICPSSVQRADLKEQMLAFKIYFRGPGHIYFKEYKKRMSRKWFRRYYFFLFFFKSSNRNWQGPIIWDEVVYNKLLSENPNFELSTIGSWKIKEWNLYSIDLYPETSKDVIEDYEMRLAYFKNYISLKKVIKHLRKPKIVKWSVAKYVRWSVRKKHRLYIEFWMFRTYDKKKS